MNPNKCWLASRRRKLDIEQVFDVYNEPLTKVKKNSFSDDQAAAFHGHFPDQGLFVGDDAGWMVKSNSNSIATFGQSAPASKPMNIIHEDKEMDVGFTCFSTQLGTAHGQVNGIHTGFGSAPLGATHQDSKMYLTSSGAMKYNFMNGYCDADSLVTNYQDVSQQENHGQSCPECLSGKAGHFSHIQTRQQGKDH